MSDVVVVVVYLFLVYIATREDVIVKSEDTRCPLCAGPLTPQGAFCECVPCGLTTWCSDEKKAEGIREANDVVE